MARTCEGIMHYSAYPQRFVLTILLYFCGHLRHQASLNYTTWDLLSSLINGKTYGEGTLFKDVLEAPALKLPLSYERGGEDQLPFSINPLGQTNARS